MEESSSLKRQRVEETQEEEVLKRQKSYKDIITLLDEEVDVPNEDLSSLISTLQEEISNSGSDPVHSGSVESDPVLSGSSESGSGGEEEEGEKVMRHLLEASDDELGIPNTVVGYSGSGMDGFDDLLGGHVDGGDLFLSVGEGLWEFEDHEATNYYNHFLQSEIFM